MRQRVFLMPGKLAVLSQPGEILTVLGSCVAVALYDRERGIGGLNHYLLPELPADESPSLRYGAVAIPQLIDAVCAAGARRARLQARLFGGGSLLGGSSVSLDIGARNVALAQKLLGENGIPIVERNVGGKLGRKIRFSTDTFAILHAFTNATEDTFSPRDGKTAPVPRRHVEAAPPARPGSLLELAVDVIAVGGNGGWPATLTKLLGALSFDSAPLVIAHGGAALVSERFARDAKLASGVSIAIAKDGVALRRGRAYLLPRGHHGRILRAGDHLSLSVLRGAPVHDQAPSSSILFHSLADSVGPYGAALLLGGFGEDGVDGLAAVKASGGATFAENPTTTVLAAGPQKAIAQGVVQTLVEASDFLFRRAKNAA